MPSFYPNVACIKQATELQTVLATGKCRLFQSTLLPDVDTTQSDLEGAEADFTGYPSGGATITAWGDPVLAPGGGAMIAMPTVTFNTGAGPVTVTNLIGGAWIEDADGDVRLILVFPAPQPMEVPNQGFPLNATIVVPTGVTV